jgi:hypothetical protein
MWHWTTANTANSTVLGQYNVWLLNSIFEIGIGISWGPVNALTVLVNGKVGINSTSPTAMLTVEGGIRAIQLTYDPCGTADYPEWALFYNDASNYYCFCDNTTTAKSMTGANCF